MCLIAFAWQQDPAFPFIFAANRDEFYARPTAPAHFWAEAPDVLAGRDLMAGGTWCGVTRGGRFAAVTNVREPARYDPDAPSRGHLVADFLKGETSARAYLEHLEAVAGRYNGFNLLAGDGRQLCYLTNRGGGVRVLEPGLYGLSNAALDVPWPKVERAKEALRAHLAAGPPRAPALFELLADARRARDEQLPETGLGRDRERLLSSIFIRSDGYGTRASTVLWTDEARHLTFAERSFDAAGSPPETVRYDFDLPP